MTNGGMTTCVSRSTLNTQWRYPVIDPYRTAGPGPYNYAYAFSNDAVVITVTRTSRPRRCQMEVELAASSGLGKAKQIQAFNNFNNASLKQIDQDPTGAVTNMTIDKWKPGDACGTGTDTLVLAQQGDFGPKVLYTFDGIDLWDFWGGCTVRFTWQLDGARGLSGEDTPARRYPVVRLPDYTLMRNQAGTGLSVVIGGTDFPADPGYLAAVASDTTDATARAILDYQVRPGPPAELAPDAPDVGGWVVGPPDPGLLAGALPFTPLPALPADFTFVREWNRPDVYVVFGGAKFRIPDPATLTSLGFDWSMVRVIPASGALKLLDTPISGTLIKEQHDPKVYLVANDKLRWVTSPAVMEARCLPWRHVRTVPDTTLSTLPQGNPLD
jgi:hypothetical protein